MNQRGNRTPPIAATEIVMTTHSKAIPRNAFGNPSSCACHVLATVEHEMTEDRSQPNEASGSAARCHASIDSTNEV
jgi:hypothetical protein